MGFNVVPIQITDVASGKALQNGGAVHLHGWILSETAGHDAVVEFKTPAPGNAPNPPVTGSPLAFSRKITASTDLAAFWSEKGIYFPRGLWVDVTGSSEVLAGILLIS